MEKIRVGILRGGVGPEYEISLASGAEALRHLDRERYKPVDIFVDRSGDWHIAGMPLSVEKLPHTADVFLNFLHGETGEDGKLKNLFDNLSLAHAGSDALASSMALNKKMAKERFEAMGIKTPKWIMVNAGHRSVLADTPPQQGGDEMQDIFELAQILAKQVWLKLSPPWVLKPVQGGSSVGVRIAKTFDELVYRLHDMLHEYDEVLVEEYVEGDEIHIAMLENFRGEDAYVSIPMQVQNDSSIFSHRERVTGDYALRPATHLSAETRQELLDTMHRFRADLGLADMFSADFVVTSRGIYLLEIDPHPAIDPHSPLRKSMEHHGISMGELLEHMIERATDGK